MLEFLKEIVGEQGALALQRAIDRVPELEKAVVPRAARAWLQSLEDDFVGTVPGTELNISFKKAEDSYIGSIDIGGTPYLFTGNVNFVVGCISVALGVRPGVPNLKKSDIYRLGVNIDLLIQGQAQGKVVKAAVVEVPKPKKRKVSLPKAKKTPKRMVKMTKSQAASKCGVCGQAQFTGNVFSGCFCFSSLAKDVSVSTKPDGYLLQFGDAWDNDAIDTLLDTIRN